MLNFPRWQLILILGVCLLGLITALPNALPDTWRKQIPWPLPNHSVSLGLDLRGGASLTLEAALEVAVKDRSESLLDEVRKALRNGKITYTGLSAKDEGVTVRIVDPTKVPEARTLLKGLVAPAGLSIGLGNSAGEYDVVVTDDGQASLTLSAAGREDLRKRVMEQSLEVVRRRIDPSGTKEVTLTRQGDRRLLLQVPGVTDTKEIRDKLNAVAKLTFHMVDENISMADIEANRIPPGEILLYEETVRNGQTSKQPIVVKERPIITGDMLTKAQGTIDSQTQQPVVSFVFNASGARRFADVTRDNIGKRFAAVLDTKVITAPVIQGAILGGTGQITGNFTMEEANNLAILLNAGALPVPLRVVDERTVGPELGADAVKAGQWSAIGGLLLVATFMLLQYRLFGVFANIALLTNLIILLGVMTALGVTLTLPGIAALVLTMGMAVDANVLIYERIREELRLGKTPLSAIDAGFKRAMATIMDANATHALAGLVLLWVGSGPVRGFAVAFVLGIITSFFTAIFVTRLQVVTWMRTHRGKALPI